jgi:hypothetical protein
MTPERAAVQLDRRVLALLGARLVVAHRAYPPAGDLVYSWQGIPAAEHVAHAADHLARWGDGAVAPLPEDHLVHAFARLYLALAQQVRGAE